MSLRKIFLADALWITGAVIVALAIAGVVNASRKDPLPWSYATVEERFAADVAETQRLEAEAAPLPEGKGVQNIGLDTFRQLVESKKALILDARPELFHRLGHVPDAISFPRAEFSQAYDTHRSTLENAAETGKSIVIYCASSSCKDAGLVSSGLMEVGFETLYIYHKGWSEWKAEGLPQEKGTKK